jgi:hypothetical protein
MPAGGTLDVSACLDRPPLDPLVLPDLDLLRFLRAFFLGSRSDLGLVQRGIGGGSLRLGFGGLLPGFAGELALALLFLRQLGRLAGRQLFLAASLLLAQLRLARIDRGRDRARSRV